MAENPDNIVMVTVATFPEAMEAHIFRNRLESDGIPCVLADENIISNQPWHSIAYGGVKLQVRVQDQEGALAIINEIRHGHNLSVSEKETCPACGSDKIKTKRNVSFLKQVLLLLFAGSVGSRRQATCLNCGHAWHFQEAR